MKPEQILSIKEMANALGRKRDYVEDMRRGGFRLPATLEDALNFIRKHGPPGKFRKLPLR